MKRRKKVTYVYSPQVARQTKRLLMDMLYERPELLQSAPGLTEEQQKCFEEAREYDAELKRCLYYENEKQS